MNVCGPVELVTLPWTCLCSDSRSMVGIELDRVIIWQGVQINRRIVVCQRQFGIRDPHGHQADSVGVDRVPPVGDRELIEIALVDVLPVGLLRWDALRGGLRGGEMAAVAVALADRRELVGKTRFGWRSGCAGSSFNIRLTWSRLAGREIEVTEQTLGLIRHCERSDRWVAAARRRCPLPVRSYL